MFLSLSYSQGPHFAFAPCAINILNKNSRLTEVNCLIFFSAQLDTNGLPELTPTLAPGETTIVAVGFDATDLTGIVKQKGIAVSVPYAFTTEDVDSVVNAVLLDYQVP
ncbi:hypothetical protein COOONC_03897 [Cooperia oncophora]